MTEAFAYLNEEGRRMWGEVFLDGKVPIHEYLPSKASLEELGDRRVYMVDIQRLQPSQFDAILDLLAEKFHAPKSAVRADVISKGLPLRENLVTVPIPSRFFA